MSWRVARSLDTLLAEINAAAPRRSKKSDGSIGDPAHASRDSDHNPNGLGVVRARDFTHDPDGGLDCHRLADRLEDMLRAGKHPALGPGAYVIWNDRIISRSRINEGWRTYGGSNPHTRHLHLSVAYDAAGYDSTTRWGVMVEPRTPRAVRRAWLAARRAIGRRRPRQVTFRFANLGSVSFSDKHTRDVWRLALTKPGKRGVPDLVGCCEAADLPQLGSDRLIQHVRYGKPGDPDSALLLAARRDRVRLSRAQLLPGTPATGEGGGFRRRPLLRAHATFDAGTRHRWGRSVLIGHAAAARAPRSRLRFLRIFDRTGASIKAGDLNIRATRARRLLGGRRVFSDGVLHVAVPRWIPVEISLVDIESDHRAIDLTLWPDD